MPPRPRRRQLFAGLIAAVLLALAACSGGDGGTGGAASPAPSGSAGTSAGRSSTAQPEGAPETKTPVMRVRPTFFGMHDGRVAQGIAPTAPVGALRFWDSNTSWRQLETSPGEFTWEPLDTAVVTAEAAGARPLLVMGQSPTFYASQPEQEASYGPGAASMPNLEAWRRYVTAVVDRYGDRIDYQVWNEANIVQYWTGTPSQMARLTIEAAQAIREVVPRATVVAPAFALRLDSQQRYFEQFWSLQSQALDLAGAVDVVAVHLYPLSDGLPEAQADLLEGARKVLSEQGIDRPVWNTEVNLGMLGGPEPPPIPAERQRAFLMRTYLLNAGLGVQRVYWYRWDIGRIANTYMTEEDLVTETLAGDSFDLVRDWLAGTLVGGCGPSEAERGLWVCTARKGDDERTFWWKGRGGAATLEVEDASSWASADGRVTRCSDKCRLPVGETPVMVVAHE